VAQGDRTARECVLEEHSGGGDYFTLQMAAADSSATFTSYKTAPRHTSETAGVLLHLWAKHVAEFVCIVNVCFYTNDALFLVYVGDCSHIARNE
jgi:hypothetical protein